MEDRNGLWLTKVTVLASGGVLCSHYVFNVKRRFIMHSISTNYTQVSKALLKVVRRFLAVSSPSLVLKSIRFIEY